MTFGLFQQTPKVLKGQYSDFADIGHSRSEFADSVMPIWRRSPKERHDDDKEQPPRMVPVNEARNNYGNRNYRTLPKQEGDEPRPAHQYGRQISEIW